MADLKPEDIKETIETQSPDEVKKYEAVGWLTIDNYTMDGKKFFVLAWVKNEPPVRP